MLKNDDGSSQFQAPQPHMTVNPDLLAQFLAPLVDVIKRTPNSMYLRRVSDGKFIGLCGQPNFEYNSTDFTVSDGPKTDVLVYLFAGGQMQWYPCGTYETAALAEQMAVSLKGWYGAANVRTQPHIG